MKGILVDSNVILDIFLDDPNWFDWSSKILEQYSESHSLCINPIVYTEVSIGFSRIEDLEQAIKSCGFRFLDMPKESLFLAGKVFLKYRKLKGNKTAPLPDFYIGAHAAVTGMPLITRDISRISHYFPSVKIISP
jgi:predicted nucleic acid-binding protein